VFSEERFHEDCLAERVKKDFVSVYEKCEECIRFPRFKGGFQKILGIMRNGMEGRKTRGFHFKGELWQFKMTRSEG